MSSPRVVQSASWQSASCLVTYVTMSDVVFKPQKCWFPGPDLSVRNTQVSSLITFMYYLHCDVSCCLVVDPKVVIILTSFNSKKHIHYRRHIHIEYCTVYIQLGKNVCKRNPFYQTFVDYRLKE